MTEEVSQTQPFRWEQSSERKLLSQHVLGTLILLTEQNISACSIIAPLHQNKKQVPPRLATVGRCFVPCTYCGRGQIAATSAAMSTCEPVLDRLALPVHIVPHHQHTQKPWVHWCGHSALIGVAGCARRMRNQQKGTFLLLCLFLSFTSLSQFFYRELMW